jgi:hypothetical protein
MMTRYNTTLHILAVIVLVAGALLAAAALLHSRPAAAARGLMPEVVVTASRPNTAEDTTVVRAGNTSDLSRNTAVQAEPN